jgi:hypothetical protein
MGNGDDYITALAERRRNAAERVEEIWLERMAARDPRDRVVEELREVFCLDDNDEVLIGRMAEIYLDDELMTVILVARQPFFGPEIKIPGVGSLSFVTPESSVGAAIAKADGPGIVSVPCPGGMLECVIREIMPPETARRRWSRRIFVAALA